MAADQAVGEAVDDLLEDNLAVHPVSSATKTVSKPPWARREDAPQMTSLRRMGLPSTRQAG
jgi:hypothetical protein